MLKINISKKIELEVFKLVNSKKNQLNSQIYIINFKYFNLIILMYGVRITKKNQLL